MADSVKRTSVHVRT